MQSGPFGCHMKLGAKQAELVQKFVPRSRVGIFPNERTQSTRFKRKLMFWCISYHLGVFETVLVALRNSVQNGPNECKSSCHEVASEYFATNATDPLHWTLNSQFCCISYHLSAFGTVWLPYKTRCKMGRTNAKFCATMSH